MEKNDVWSAALAGLLHDIGKFALRAGASSSRAWDAAAKQEFGYRHALLTGEFIERHLPAAWREHVRAAAGNYNRPNTLVQYAVTLADRLAAGASAALEEDGAAVQPRQLQSIFCSLEMDGERAPEPFYWPLFALRLDEHAIFPGQPKPEQELRESYKQLWNAFVAGAQQLATAYSAESAGEQVESYLESLLLLLQRCAWCVPSAYDSSLPDVSLYDHARVTAALSALLVSGQQTEENLRQMLANPEKSEQEVALLIGGDLSGVQAFLYTITARGATSALRGRSFYMQLLTEAAVRYVLRRLNLPITNLLYAGGGNFYLLARPADAARLEDIQREIGRVLFKAHRGDLYLSLGTMPLKARDFYEGRISQQWGALTEVLQHEKQRRFACFGSDLAAVFAPEGHGGNLEQSCAVCGSEDPDPKKERREDGEIVRKCRTCASFEALGEDLRNARYLVLSLLDPSIPERVEAGAPEPYEAALCALGLQAEVKNEVPGAAHGASQVIFALNDAALDSLQPRAGRAVGRRMISNVTPLLSQEDYDSLKQKGVKDLPQPGKIKPFHVLEYQSKGIKRLGILRMDVDNLGRMFSHGFGKNATLSRVASLSFAVSLYFEGWVGVLGDRLNQEQNNRLYSIYAGGDDLFYVGSWDVVVELARQVRDNLSRFACSHPGIHASAGIVLVGGKYPLAQAAEEAGRAESQAKALRWVDQAKQAREKDAVTFLGRVCPWERFGLEEDDVEGFETVHGMMRYLERREKLHSLLRRLIYFQEMYDEEVEKRRKEGRDVNRSGQPQALFGRWNWLAAYTLKRMETPSNKKDLNILNERLREDDFSSIEWIGLAARWAELATR